MTKISARRRWALGYGDASLDFVNTRWNRLTPEPIETFHQADDVLDWLRLKGIIDDRHHRLWRRRFRQSPTAARRLFGDAMRLREALYRVFWSIAHRHRPRPADIAVVNRVLAAVQLSPVLSVDRTRCVSVVYRPTIRGVRSLVAPVAAAAAQVLSNDALARLRQCLNAECAAVFFDRTKNRSRRWCHMTVCGSVFKMRRYRKSARRSDRPP